MIFRDDRLKKRNYFKYKEEIIYDAIKDLVDGIVNETFSTYIELYGNLKVNAIVLFGKEEDTNLFRIDQNKLIEELSFSTRKNGKLVEYIHNFENKKIKILKLTHNDILKIIADYLTYDYYNTPYLLNMKFFGMLGKDFRLIGILGDYRDIDIESIDIESIDKKIDFSGL